MSIHTEIRNGRQPVCDLEAEELVRECNEPDSDKNGALSFNLHNRVREWLQVKGHIGVEMHKRRKNEMIELFRCGQSR